MGTCPSLALPRTHHLTQCNGWSPKCLQLNFLPAWQSGGLWSNIIPSYIKWKTCYFLNVYISVARFMLNRQENAYQRPERFESKLLHPVYFEYFPQKKITLFIYLFIYRAWLGERSREGDKHSPHLSGEPQHGALIARTLRSRSELKPKVRCSMNWATQAPLIGIVF